MKELFGSTGVLGASMQRNPLTGSISEAPTQLAQRPVAVMELLKRKLDVPSIQLEIDTRIQMQYSAILNHHNMRPYVSHEVEYILVSQFNLDTYKAANHAPDKLHIDLQVGVVVSVLSTDTEPGYLESTVFPASNRSDVLLHMTSVDCRNMKL